MTKLHTNKMTSRRAVAPVIATLLLVAIAVVGGSIIFVFSQGFFSSAQISGNPAIESVKILGYDSTDGGFVQFHDGLKSTSDALGGNQTSDGLKAGEYVAVYLKNDSVNKITVSEVRLAGTTYTYQAFATAIELPPSTTADGSSCAVSDNVDCKEYAMVTQADNGSNDNGLVSAKSAPELEPGQEATMILALEKDIKVGRDLQYKLTTTNGAVFVSTVNSGQQSG
jgi:flagellin-like protein